MTSFRSSLSILGVTLLVTACSPATPSGGGSSSSSSTMSTSADARVIEITAKNFAFAPNSISVKKGEKVKLRITSTEGNHGFGIPDLGINTVINDGKTVEIELPTDEAGTFSFLCTVPCGPGHMDMKGTIVIS